MLSGTANATLADAQEKLDVKIQPLLANGSTRNVQRLQIWALSVLPAVHPLYKCLEDHYNDMESFCPIWLNWRPALHSQLRKAHRVYHLKYMSTELSEFWKEQAQSATPVTLPSPRAISSAINQEHHWEPHLSTFFLKYKVYKFCGVTNSVALPPSEQLHAGGILTGTGENRSGNLPDGSNIGI